MKWTQEKNPESTLEINPLIHKPNNLLGIKAHMFYKLNQHGFCFNAQPGKII